MANDINACQIRMGESISIYTKAAGEPQQQQVTQNEADKSQQKKQTKTPPHFISKLPPNCPISDSNEQQSTSPENRNVSLSSNINEENEVKYSTHHFGEYVISKKNTDKEFEEQCKNDITIGKLIKARDIDKRYLGEIVIVKWRRGTAKSAAIVNFKREIDRELKMKKLKHELNEKCLLIVTGTVPIKTDRPSPRGCLHISFMISIHEGMNVRKYVKLLQKNNKIMTETMIRMIFITIMAFMLCMHKRGYLHHDLKPENILINAFDKDYKDIPGPNEYDVDELYYDPSKIETNIIDFGELMEGIEIRSDHTSRLVSITQTKSDQHGYDAQYGPPEYVGWNDSSRQKFGFRSDNWSMAMTGWYMIEAGISWNSWDQQQKFLDYNFFKRDYPNGTPENYNPEKDLIMPDPPKIPQRFWNGQLISSNLYDFLKINLVYDHRERASLKRLLIHPFIIGRNSENKCNDDQDDVKMENKRSNESDDNYLEINDDELGELSLLFENISIDNKQEKKITKLTKKTKRRNRRRSRNESIEMDEFDINEFEIEMQSQERRKKRRLSRTKINK